MFRCGGFETLGRLDVSPLAERSRYPGGRIMAVPASSKSSW
jgi:hypothetical protein